MKRKPMKILITSIGRGVNADENGERNISSYKRANYQWQNEEPFSTCYVADAMKHFFPVDGIMLLGTAGSDWASLYYYILTQEDCTLKREGAIYDERYLKSTLNLLSDSNQALEFANLTGDMMKNGEKPIYHHQLDTEKVEKALKPLQETIDGCMDIIVLKYGVDKAEQMDNIRALYRMEELLDDGDELYIDLTHAFRSLQFFELVALTYFRKVSRKNIIIKMLSYGQFESRHEYGNITKIVDMSGLLNLMELFNAASEYRMFGTLHDVDGLPLQLKTEEEEILHRFGDAISINNIVGFGDLISESHKLWLERELEKKEARHELNFLLDDVLRDIDSGFYKDKDDPTKTQLNLARWHYEHKRYLIAITTAQEAFITWGLNLIEIKAKSYDERDTMKTAIRNLGKRTKSNSVEWQISSSFNKACLCRNGVAHPQDEQFDVSKKIGGIDSALSSLENSYNRFMKLDIFKKNAISDKLSQEYDNAEERRKKRK